MPSHDAFSTIFSEISADKHVPGVIFAELEPTIFFSEIGAGKHIPGVIFADLEPTVKAHRPSRCCSCWKLPEALVPMWEFGSDRNVGVHPRLVRILPHLGSCARPQRHCTSLCISQALQVLVRLGRATALLVSPEE